jgi:RNA polymerase sigma factor
VGGVSLRFGDRGPADRLLALAQSGRREARDRLVQDYMPLIVQTASQASGRYLQPGADEEISVALMAFDEAIDAYRPERGTFPAFARLVIRRRLADFYRRRQRGEVVWTALEELDAEGQVRTPILDRVSQQLWRLEEDQAERAREIEEYETALAAYGIRFADLAEDSPKHRDARERALMVAQYIASRPDLVEWMERYRRLPLKPLEELSWVARKTLERHRRYIIAVAVILMNDWPHLKEYVKPGEGTS